jgi:ABC-type molybdenum transport system ATPase subunit/photorepair protein PhrA
VLAGEHMHYASGQDITEVQPPSGRRNRRGRLLIKIRHADVFIKHNKILHDISWVMHRAEHWSVIGRNGAGKSTLLKLIAGDVYPALGGEVLRFGEKDSGSIWNIRKRIGIVSPELQRDYDYNVNGTDVVVSGFFSSVGLYGPATSSQRETARYWIDFFQLRHLSEKLFQEMSYGEQRKILIARAMANSPDILIADEPCGGLDGAARAGFLSFIAQVARSGTALIMATHHPDEIISLITHIMVMDKGRIIAQGKKEEIMKSHQELLSS